MGCFRAASNSEKKGEISFGRLHRGVLHDGRLNIGRRQLLDLTASFHLSVQAARGRALKGTRILIEDTGGIRQGNGEFDVSVVSGDDDGQRSQGLITITSPGSKSGLGESLE